MKRKIVVFVDSQGSTTARTTTSYDHDAWQIELYNLKQRGFIPFSSFNIPARFDHDLLGWYKYYRYHLNWLVKQYGL